MSSHPAVSASNLGFPRIGARRELKRALESFWAGKADAASLHAIASELRAKHWRLQHDAGVTPSSNDFSFYDQVLDMVMITGAVPDRYRALDGDPLRQYFAMARGDQRDGVDLPAMEMTKWFDTNYHYIVPEFDQNTSFRLGSEKPVEEYLEAKALGIETRPVLLGPISFLTLGKMADGGSALTLLDGLLPIYETLLRRLAAAGARWVQIDEPILVLDLSEAHRAAFRTAYDRLAKVGDAPQAVLTTYFGALGDNLDLATSLPVAGLHVDLVRAPEQLDAVLAALPADRVLSAGIIDGRNIWRTDLDTALGTLRTIATARPRSGLIVAPSCSLLHSPVGLDTETALDAELRSWLAFATEKLSEVEALTQALGAGGEAAASAFASSSAAVISRRASTRIHRAEVDARLDAITAESTRRQSPYPTRRSAQRSIGLPTFPTTTIGSFPQTAAVRNARADHKKGTLDTDAYDRFLRDEIERTVRIQETIGLDVLVHGEFERNDMVEYFGERLDGFAFTANGWVQSYGSRCVKPPIIYGDVVRPAPMTVSWSRFAQSLTDRPMKGMLTGPVTILQWSFVRDDQPRDVTCRQIALAIRDEVVDLEAAGLRVIQIDEPAIREGLPLRKADWAQYLAWAVDAFRIASSGVRDETQIHTHMCYSEFNDIVDAVASMDADVVSIETSRSKMELLDAFARFAYPNEIGPGVYDIHSPRVPPEAEMVTLLRRAAEVIPADRLWVNPDCGLKTRGWPEVERALTAMVAAARTLRAEQAAASN